MQNYDPGGNRSFSHTVKLTGLMLLLSLFLILVGYPPKDVYAAGTGEETVTEATADPAYTIEDAAKAAREMIKAHEDTFVVPYISKEDLDQEKFEHMISSIFAETGIGDEGDYLQNEVRGYSVGTSGYSMAGTYYIDLHFQMDYLTTLEEEQAVTAKLQQVYKSLSLSGKTDAEKINVLYDYVTKHIEYDYDHLNDMNYRLQFTPYAALITGKAVCQGISALFYRMLVDNGLQARIVGGNARNDAGVSGSHSWNIVKIGSVYYYLDATWDLGGYRDYYLYGEDDYSNHFLRSDFLTEDFTAAYPMSRISYAQYLEEQAAVLTGWQVVDGKKYYYSEEGKPLTGAQKIDGKIYYFNSRGVMQTGWLKKSGKIYYLGEDGALIRKRGAVIDGNTYYFNSKGIMQTGWLKKSGKTYYFNEAGVMKTGWVRIDGHYYRFGRKGVMLTGWTTYKGQYYYLKEDGTMMAGGTLTIDGTDYVFYKKGVCLTPHGNLGNNDAA